MYSILALHSSSDTLGIACSHFGDQKESCIKVTSFPIKRRLSNDLLTCIESVIPARNWNQLVRLAVAIGPGGFTSTRLTVAIARILAQQLGCPLDGVNSLFLAAYRFRTTLQPFVFDRPFWLIHQLSQESIVAGCYAIDLMGIQELENPKLIQLGELEKLEPRFNIKIEVEKDVIQLLRFSQNAMSNAREAPWHHVTPLYLTSPLSRLLL
ncbi:MAG TPA: tRNA (adenosine(37)-N6)-threonylcarbamoyltransferase complex dimerization subunit type 1 TsaB [Prochlorococcaceae cyanobacterium AMR_MDS_5431]|nr:tRNA (adenosine(37)-N6)-threonylcarbamoyltransferase complex dimerization subunit type 1 TsaB [Prochlorococcaceae cyanobacterium AMR_MDS_5431]